jgi:hypothetical protein
MNVNVLSRSFKKGRNNYWVDLHIRRVGVIAEINYVDPTGRPIDEGIQRALQEGVGLQYNR